MKYRDFFISDTIVIEESLENLKESEMNENLSAEDLLRKNGIKIKMITKTSFGTQIDLAKKYKKEVITNIIKDKNFKIKDNSIFIEH